MGKETGVVAVTGASGLVGSHLVEELLKGDNSIRLILRESSSLARLEKRLGDIPDRVSVIRTELTNPHTLGKAFEGVDVVYHCAAVVGFDSDRGGEIIRINREITSHVVDACMESGVRRLVHVSSIATLGECPTNGGTEFVDEECYLTNLVGRSAYSVSKLYAENQVNRGIYQGLDAVIVNPAIIIGEGDFDNGSGQLIKYIAGGGFFAKFVSLFAPSGVKGYVDVCDVARAMRLLADCDKASGNRFVLSSANLSFRELFTLIAKDASKQAPIFTVGRATMNLFSSVDGCVSKLLGRKPLLTPEIISNAIDKTYYNGDKIRAYIDFEYIPIEETIKRVTESYISKC